jgi:OmpA-OmpF porin, OOP family
VPVELLGGVRFAMTEEWTLTGGAGAGLSNGYGTPDWRVFFGITGQWVTGGWWWVDYRQPGFRGEVDPCDERSQARGRRLRFDPIADCPEPVVVLDEEEREARMAILEEPPVRVPRQPREPREPEVVQEQDEGAASLRHGAIIITEQVNFRVGSAEILEDSYPVLDAVVRILRRQEDIRLMRVEGHTDSVGNANANLRLSQARSESVRDYLVRNGIAPERVQAIGYGEERPVADNSTDEGRALNRRVEFNVLDMGDSQ